jgi:single-strand DNA-binding protein
MYQNRATLIGFLGKDAEVKITRNNTSFTVLSLATKRNWKDRESGQYMSDTTWHRCIVWGKLGEFAATLTKGAHVQVEGDIRTREYTPKAKDKTPEAVRKAITEIRVFTINKLDRPPKGGDHSEAEGAAA